MKFFKINLIFFLIVIISPVSYSNSDISDPYEKSNRSIHEFNDKRFFLTSYTDFENIENFIDSNIMPPSLIASPWHLYGRDQKIDHVLSKITSLCL